ncbi:MAG: hypothetical protein ACLP50_34165 [Solirubrobacteraceae bacterium]
MAFSPTTSGPETALEAPLPGVPAVLVVVVVAEEVAVVVVAVLEVVVECVVVVRVLLRGGRLECVALAIRASACVVTTTRQPRTA